MWEAVQIAQSEDNARTLVSFEGVGTKKFGACAEVENGDEKAVTPVSKFALLMEAADARVHLPRRGLRRLAGL